MKHSAQGGIFRLLVVSSRQIKDANPRVWEAEKQKSDLNDESIIR